MATINLLTYCLRSKGYLERSTRANPEAIAWNLFRMADFVVEYSIPQQKIFILFSHFRVDTSGNVLARFRLNGQEIGGSGIELLNAAPGTSPTTDKNEFTISAKELISTDFADATSFAA